MRELPSTEPSVKKLLNHINYFGQTTHSDAQGRILIPAVLREAAEIKGEVAVLGFFTYFEVWNDRLYREQLEGEAADRGRLEGPERLRNLSRKA